MANHKKIYRVKLLIEGKEHGLAMPEDETILESALQAGFDLPHLCLQGWCTTCAAKIVAGEVDQSRAFRIFPQDEKQGFVLLCSAFPKSDLKIITHQKAAMRKFRIERNLPVPRG